MLYITYIYSSFATVILFNKDEKCGGRDEKVPQDFTQIGNDYYLISTEEMPWLQAQYDCMNRQGLS